MTLFGKDIDTVVQFFPRPNRYDEDIVKRTFVKWSEDIEGWLRDLDDDFAEGVEVWRKELVDKLIDHDFDLYLDRDPYEIGKEFERIFAYEVDSEFLDLCDKLVTIWNREYEKAEKIWVKDNGIKPHLSEGDRGLWNKPNEKEGIPVVIKRIITDKALFVVKRVDSEGKDVPDVIRGSTRITGSVVPYEHVTKI